MSAFGERCTYWLVNPDHVLSPGVTPAPPSLLLLRGKTVNSAVLLRNSVRIGFIFSERPGFPAARAGFVRDFYGDGMGKAKREEGRGEGEKLLGKTLLFGIFL